MPDLATPKLRHVVTISGPVEVNGGTVYVGGMDLADVLRAAMPGRDDPKYQGKYDMPGVTLRVEAEAL